MTELMKQLQQWADEGRYDWQRNRFKTPHGILNYEELVFMVEDRIDFIKKDYRLRHRQMEKILLVLDGIIPAWRPVEHYPPPKDTEVLALFFISENASYEHGIFETNVQKDFTYWQPLPQFIHEGKETNDV